MEISKLMFWGLIIFTSAGTAAINLILPPDAGVGTQTAIVMWWFFSIIGLLMMLYAWGQKIKS